MDENLRTALLSFGFTGLVHMFSCIDLSALGAEEDVFVVDRFWLHLLLLSPVSLLLSCLIFKNKKVALHASFLGCVVSLGILLKLSPKLPLWHPFGTYMAVMGLFHWSEYVCTGITSPSTLSLDSFLLNHSIQYWIAAGASWIEFVLGIFFVPKLKSLWVLSAFGLLVCMIGEFVRKSAMFTAGSNFTHLISYEKKEGHQLVTRGIYSLFRHPSYVGWFFWSVGTQILLCNPICFVGYAWASWSFFRERIKHEEQTLIEFFGEDYIRYQQRVPTGIPFVPGFRPDY